LDEQQMTTVVQAIRMIVAGFSALMALGNYIVGDAFA
jgi:hypothetical protein